MGWTRRKLRAGGTKGGFATEEAAGDGEGGIEEGDGEGEEGSGEGEEGSGHAEEGGGFLGPDDAEAAKEEADRQATAIAHKDGRGVDVGGEKSEEGAEERGSDEGQGVVATEGGAQEDGGCGAEAHTDGEAIEAIDEIKGVGTSDQPEDGNRDVPPSARDGMTGHGVDLDIRITGQGGGDDLAEDLHPWFQAKDVIEKAGGERDENGRQESPNTGERGGNGAGAPERRVEEDQERERVGKEDGDTACAGDRSLVDLPGPRLIYPAQADARSSAHGGERQGEQKGGNCK